MNKKLQYFEITRKKETWLLIRKSLKWLVKVISICGILYLLDEIYLERTYSMPATQITERYFDTAQVIKDYQRTESQINALEKKMSADNYVYDHKDNAKLTLLRQEQVKKVDTPISKLLEAYKIDGQKSLDFINKVKQGIQQGIQHQHAGMFSFIATMASGVGIKAYEVFIHNPRYGILMPSKTGGFAERAERPQKLQQVINAGAYSLGGR